MAPRDVLSGVVDGRPGVEAAPEPAPVWESAQIAVLDDAVASAAAGVPTLVVVEGEAGLGKTSLLDELERRAHGFAVHAAEGTGRESVPFGVLAQWGADAALEASSGFVAAQLLREHLDRRGARARMLVRLDDLHRADPDSVDALGWLLRRAAGDRLLVAVAFRGSEAPGAGWWQPTGRYQTRHVRLGGLSERAVATLVRRRHPRTDATLAARLSEHTGGNPLYLAAILDEHDPVALHRMRVLPAPKRFVDVIAARLERLPGAAVALARAAAVLGVGWHTLPALAAVADVEDPATPAQALADAGLLHVAHPDPEVRVRLAHALVVAAVHAGTPLPDRAALHERAAATAADTSSALEHRVLAAVRWDAELADAVEAHAEELHGRRRHRAAAQFLRQAATLTADPVTRGHRILDAALQDAFARDFAAAHAALDSTDGTVHDGYRVAVRGAVLSLEGRRAECAAVLDGVDSTAGGLPPRTAFRMYALLAWALYGAGRPTAATAEAVAHALALGVDDPVVAPHLMFTRGSLEVRRRGIDPVLAELDGALPKRPDRAPAGDAYLLAWRGTLRLDAGLFAEAAEDLEELQRRILEGLPEIAEGAFHALLGFAQWLDGRWDLARISIGIALDRAGAATAADPTDEVGGVVYPFAHLVAPLGALAVGEPRRADRLLERVAAALERRPWPEAVRTLLVARVVHAHAVGSPAERADLLADTRRRWPDLDTQHAGPPWLLHAALAAVWAGELDDAEAWVEQLTTSAPTTPWAAWAAPWLRGLVAEARGATAIANEHLGAAAQGTDGMPLYRAHVLVDHARVLRASGRAGAADEALAVADRLYRAVGAPSYVDRVTHLRGTARPHVARNDPLDTLTEREHDVLALVATGLSYVQIARRLYITRSTVGYHLSNIYAKTGVASRHELTELARRASPG